MLRRSCSCVRPLAGSETVSRWYLRNRSRPRAQSQNSSPRPRLRIYSQRTVPIRQPRSRRHSRRQCRSSRNSRILPMLKQQRKAARRVNTDRRCRRLRNILASQRANRMNGNSHAVDGEKINLELDLPRLIANTRMIHLNHFPNGRRPFQSERPCPQSSDPRLA